MISKNIIIVDVGGQGTLPTSRVFGKLAIGADYDVKLSEVHGMAQRGGSVVAFVRYEEKVTGLIMEEGQVDVLIAFERLEALRYPRFLKKDGVITVNNWRIDPTTVATGAAEYLEGIIGRPKKVRKTIVVEATEEAKKMGAPKVSSVIVLGAAAKHMGSEKEDWLEVIETTAPPKMVEISKEVFEAGYTFSVQTDKSRR